VRYQPPARLCYSGGADGGIPAACGCGSSPLGVRIAARADRAETGRGRRAMIRWWEQGLTLQEARLGGDVARTPPLSGCD